MAKYAFLIGVSIFSDKNVSPVRFATADAEDLSEAFEKLGFNTTVVVDGRATKTAIKSKLQKAIDILLPDDTFCLFIASHGYSEGGKNFIYCHDTQPDDLKKTSLGLRWVYELLRSSGCEQCMMFLDACETGVEFDEGMRAHVGELSEAELIQLADEATYCVGFAACRIHQKSYSSTRLGHGIWTHCLIEALSGNAKEALEGKRFVTAAKLQTYLRQEVPRQLRKDWPSKVQTPWQFGGQSGNFVVADLGNLLAGKRKSPPFGMAQLKRVLFRADETGDIRKLSGFKRGFHHIPKDVSDAAAGFVGRIAVDEISKDLERMFAKLKDSFSYKRKDLDVRGPRDGGGTIDTPQFTYSISITQNPEAEAEYLLEREITNIKDSAVVYSDEFNEAFDGVFDTLEFQFGKGIDVEDVIDSLEKARIQVDYDSSASSARLSLPSLPLEIEFDEASVRLIHKTARPPRELVENLEAFRKIAAQEELKMLPMA
jgi:hypothetical protein